MHQTNMDNLIVKLYQSTRTVFSNKDLALIWVETNSDNLKAKTAYYVKRGVLTRLTRGIFAKGTEYDAKELATSIYTPSYISFETVLLEAGIIFQYYDTIFVAAPWPETKQIGKNKFAFRKLKDSVLYSAVGVKNDGNFAIASLERAFLDTIYLFPKYYFDNLRPIDWDKCAEIVKIYQNTALVRRLSKYRRQYAKS